MEEPIIDFAIVIVCEGQKNLNAAWASENVGVARAIVPFTHNVACLKSNIRVQICGLALKYVSVKKGS